MVDNTRLEKYNNFLIATADIQKVYLENILYDYIILDI